MTTLIRAAKKMEKLIIEREGELSLPTDNLEYGTKHLKYMCRRIYNGFVTGDKAWLWLGYVQGVIRSAGGSNVDELIEVLRED